MKIIGELLNSTREEVKEKIKVKDEQYIRTIARQQKEAGADYIDVNAGEFTGMEKDYLLWMVEQVQKEVDCPLSLDSANSEAIIAVMENYQGNFLLNSISAEKEKYTSLIEPVKEFEPEVVALCLDDDGIPKTALEKTELAEKLTDRLLSAGINEEKIYLDPLVQPVSVEPDAAQEVLKTINNINKWDLDVNIICGLSNVSYGLPERKLLNQAFLVLCREKGLNSAIANPLDKYLISLLKATDVLLEKDSRGMNFIRASRNEQLGIN